MKINGLFAACLLVSSCCAYSAEIVGRVVGIADGDTLTVLDSSKVQHKIRLGGIDAPEKKQAFGNVSKQALSDCAFAREVTVQWDKVDRYQRKVGKVLSGGIDCNLRQIQLGLAWHYKKYAGDQPGRDSAIYARAEEKALELKLGLWSDASAQAPWEFRADGR